MELQRIIELAEPELGDALAAYVERHRPTFLQLNSIHPLPRRAEYVSLGEAFWLYRLTLELAPKLVVESGTMDGYSAWWLRQATPQVSKSGAGVPLVTFDPAGPPPFGIEHGSILYGAAADSNPFLLGRFHRHHAADFTEVKLVGNGDDPLDQLYRPSLVFFDDHQDQGARLDQAAAAGFRHVLFHDTYPGSGAHPSLWERGVGRFAGALVFQFPTLRLGPPYCDRWLTYVRLR